MSFGIIEIISLLLGLQGFGLQANPKAPTADQALQYGMADADVIIHFDAASVIPGNYKVLLGLADQPQIKASPELSKMVRKAIGEVEGVRGLAKTASGIDVTTDISDATMFLQIVPKHDPNGVLAVHGKFSTAIVDKLAKMSGKASVKAGAGAWADIDSDSAVGVTKDGVLLFGTSKLVKERVDNVWQAPGHPTGSNLGYAADVIAGKPVLAFVMGLSPTARAEALANAGGQNFITDLVKRHKMASFALYRDGVGWSWVDSTKAGMDSMAEVSDGVVDILRAAQVAPRGFAKIVLGAIESYKGMDKRVDDLIKHKADVMKLVDAYVGDGTFKAQVDKDPKTFRLGVRLTGKSLSEVLPIGGLIPLGAIGMLVSKRSPDPMPMAIPEPAPAPPPTKKKP
jgi:hypothetical protein